MERQNANQLQLLTETNDPSKFAAVIQQNLPMDLTCVMAVPGALKKLGLDIPNMTIKVEFSDGRVFTTGSTNGNINGGLLIDLILSEKHYQLRGHSNLSLNPTEDPGNNCLYEALVVAIPKLAKVMPAVFRDAISDNIKENLEIQQYIQSGHHQALLKCGVFGGSPRKKSKFAPNRDPNAKTPVHQHLLKRFYIVFALAGIVQWVSEVTKIRQLRVFIFGPSKYQDRTGTHEYPAAHVIRIQINPALEKWPRIYEFLKNIVGSTDLIPKYANVPGFIGGHLDAFQALSIIWLLSVDYSDPCFPSYTDYKVTGRTLKEKIEVIFSTLSPIGVTNEIFQSPGFNYLVGLIEPDPPTSDEPTNSDKQPKDPKDESIQFSKEAANGIKYLFETILNVSLEHTVDDKEGHELSKARDIIKNLDWSYLLNMGSVAYWYAMAANVADMPKDVLLKNGASLSAEGLSFNALGDFMYYEPTNVSAFFNLAKEAAQDDEESAS